MGELTMKNKKILIATVVTGLTLSLVGIGRVNLVKTTELNSDRVSEKAPEVASSKNEALSIIPVQRFLGNHAIFDSVEELETISDLIIVGKATTDLGQDKSVVVRNSNGEIENFYTLTPFQVNKVLKGSTTDKEVKVLQAVAITEQSEQQPKTMLIKDDYSTLKKNSFYLLFLKQVDAVEFPSLAGTYSIVAINQGKFNLDKSDKEEEANEQKDDQYKNLKAKVLDKHKALIVNSP